MDQRNFTCELSHHGRLVQSVEAKWNMSDTSVSCIEIQIYPVSGPAKGGTLIIVSVINEDDDPDYFSIDGAKCANITEFEKKDDVFRFSCITGKVSETNNGTIQMSFKGCPIPITKNIYFTYKNPVDIQNFYPNKGILAGNTTITITGQNISFEGPDRYNIEFCDENNVTCIECRILDSVNMNDSKIMCKTGESNATRNLTKLVVVIDSLTTLQLTRTFQYLPDPTFDISNETLKAIESGGSTFTINGDGFNNVGQITVERVDEPCEVPSDKQAVCQTPEKLTNQPNVQTVIVNFDGIARAFEINYVDDPSFERFDGVNQYEKESSITIKGKNILNGARFEDYNIQVGLDGKCLISGKSDIDMDFIKCVPPKNVPRTNKSDVNTVHVIVEVGRIEVYIGDLQYQEDVKVLAIIVGVLAAALVIAVTIGILAVVILRKKKRKAIKEFKMELMTREEMVRKASREEFADAQMTMRSIKSDLFTSKVPFCDYQTYIFRQLFPNQDITTNHLLQDLEISGEKNDGIKTAMDNLEILLSNKHFLKSLVQTLDRPNMLTIQEKSDDEPIPNWMKKIVTYQLCCREKNQVHELGNEEKVDHCEGPVIGFSPVMMPIKEEIVIGRIPSNKNILISLDHKDHLDAEQHAIPTNGKISLDLDHKHEQDAQVIPTDEKLLFDLDRVDELDEKAISTNINIYIYLWTWTVDRCEKRFEKNYV
ncbi:PLXNB [Mytilus edulis]|uniref:PLXNB n=1 Tax=Mytilus edulis TaxID=6550 RepID=A0A8S3SV21_MYTED|nr:PLXNB [Mytilus edulis]